MEDSSGRTYSQRRDVRLSVDAKLQNLLGDKFPFSNGERSSIRGAFRNPFRTGTCDPFGFSLAAAWKRTRALSTSRRLLLDSNDGCRDWCDGTSAVTAVRWIGYVATCSEADWPM